MRESRGNDDEPCQADWQLHLVKPAATGSSLQLAGCEFAPEDEPLTLWQALEEQEDSTALALIARGAADVNEHGGPYGSTPLGWAALTGRAQLVESLLGHQADPQLPARRGAFPLHMATWNGDFSEVVDLLLVAGAKPEVKNAQGQSPLDVARELDALERTSLLDATYEMEAWRARWGKPKVGRARIIAALESVSKTEGALSDEQPAEIGGDDAALLAHADEPMLPQQDEEAADVEALAVDKAHTDDIDVDENGVASATESKPEPEPEAQDVETAEAAEAMAAMEEDEDVADEDEQQQREDEQQQREEEQAHTADGDDQEVAQLTEEQGIEPAALQEESDVAIDPVGADDP